MEEKYTTNVIEIKPDKKYMFILETDKRLSVEEFDRIKANMHKALENKGLTDSFTEVIIMGMKSKIIEMDKETSVSEEDLVKAADEEPDGNVITRP